MSLSPTHLLDRTAAFSAGLLLTAVGVAAVGWHTHWVRGLPRRISAGPMVRATDAGWWPWALAGFGVLSMLTALVWLVAHVPTRRGPVLKSLGADRGFITVSLDGVASAAAEVVASAPGVVSAKGKAVTDRGTVTVELTVTVSHPTALATVIPAIDAATAQIAQVTGDPKVAARTFVQVAKTASSRRQLQ